MALNNFFVELKRRNVYKVAVAYAVCAWLVIQIATQVFPFFEVPNWAVRIVVVVLVLGFPVALVLSWAFEITPEGIKRESELRPDERGARRTGRKIVALTVALATIAAGMLGWQLAGPKFHAAAQLKAENEAPATPEKSIAVLPMMNSTGDPANEYFSDGMSEEFITSLSRLQELKVIGRTSSFQFKGKSDDSKTIGQKLGVYYLLEGSVRQSADRVRITVALIKSGDGASVWSETYDRELKDIFAVQSEVAGAVARELRVALLGHNGQAAQLTTTATPSNRNVQAYSALLQGKFHDNRSTADDTRKAIGHYEEAIRLDPNYALAYARLASAAVNLAAIYGSTADEEGKEAIAKARFAAKRALELDPNLPEAHSAQGSILSNVDFNFTAAEAEQRRAFELAPQSPVVMPLANLMARLGRFDEAVALMQRAIALEPLRVPFLYNLTFVLSALGRYDEAEATLRKAIELQPQAAQNYLRLAVIQILRDQPDAALELAKQETDPFWRTYALALAHFAHGDHAQADAALKKLIDENSEDSGVQIATVYALRKEPEKMFEWLEHAWTTHDAGVTELLVDPFLRVYKDDPRFIAFAQKIGVIPKVGGGL